MSTISMGNGGINNLGIFGKNQEPTLITKSNNILTSNNRVNGGNINRSQIQQQQNNIETNTVQPFNLNGNTGNNVVNGNYTKS